MHIIQSHEYFCTISQHILIFTLYPSACKSATVNNFCSRIFSVPVTLGYGNETGEIMAAFADMIFCSIRLIGMLSTTELDTRKFYVFAVSYGRICPSPKITYFVVVSASNPIGPLACNFCVLIPISAPNPNSNPSVNLVDALT